MTQKDQSKMEKIVSLAKRRGFVFPGSEIYGGLANSWDYGPLGVLLKNNIKKLWWDTFVTQRIDIAGLDAAIIMNSKVWQASGHVDTFHDPLVECTNCHKRFRADEIEMSSNSPRLPENDENREWIFIGIWECPDCHQRNSKTEPKDFNLMFKTHLGPTGDSASEVYLRPETAQGIFVNFKNVLDSYNMKMPFGIAQIGKAFRNEITPGNYIFRTREFEQMEIEYFVHESQWEQSFDTWLKDMKAFLKAVGVDESKLHYIEVPDQERAHYSKRTIDIEFDFPFGRKELMGLAYRTDYDLRKHQEHSGQKMMYRDPETGDEYIPHVIEPSLGVDRLLLAILCSAYEEVDTRSGDTDAKHEKEIVLRLNQSITPVQVAVLPLSKKEDLISKSKTITQELVKHFRVEYHSSGSIGKRYRRQDEIGTPFCITVDFETLDDNQVTIRDRDTMEQQRIKVDSLVAYLQEKLL